MHIVTALEAIGYKKHYDEYGELYGDWEAKVRSDAKQIAVSITSFNFLVVFLSLYQYLSHLSGITLKLQQRTLGIMDAHHRITEVTRVYQQERKDIDRGFCIIYDQSVRMAEKVGSVATFPRTGAQQRHRSNVAATSPFEHYKRNIAIPLLDHIILELEEQFSNSSLVATSVMGLVPSVLCTKDINLQQAVEMYAGDLPSELMDMELRMYKYQWSSLPAAERPPSLAKAIKECDRQVFPNIWTLLQIACTLPVTSCECERNASALRRLNSYMRESMGKQRLSSLALLHIHLDKDINLDMVTDIFAKLHPRRLEMESLFL